MADLLPSSRDTSSAEEADPRVIGLDSEAADDLLSALSSETARSILATLHEEPATPSEVADRVDTSLQNAQYHLGNLEDAGAIEVADTAYSEKGREMSVYAPADRPLVVYAGREQETDGLRAALSRLLGGLATVGLGSLAVQAVFGDGPGRSVLREVVPSTGVTPEGGGGGDGGDGGGAEPTTEAGGVVEETTTPRPTETATESEDGDIGIEQVTETQTEGGGTTPTPTSTPMETATATEAPVETVERTVTETMTVTREVAEMTTAAATGGVDGATGVPPGALFFAGGATVLLGWVVLRALRGR